MRKIVSKHEEKKRNKRNLKIIGSVLIFVMFGSVFGIIVNSFLGGHGNVQTNSVEYNGYEFFDQHGLWYLPLEEATFAFLNHPSQIENIATQVNLFNSYAGRPLYIYSEDDIARNEIHLNLGQAATRVQSACLSEEKCEDDLPIKTCSDNFIIIEEGETEITQSERCVYIRGPKEELPKLADEFLFHAMGIK